VGNAFLTRVDELRARRNGGDLPQMLGFVGETEDNSHGT
jgi:hypothetical protein